MKKTCLFCFMREGSRCYAEPVDREEDGTSKKIVDRNQECDVPDKFLDHIEFYKTLADCVPKNKKQ